MTGSPTLFVTLAQPRAGEVERYWRYAEAATELFRAAGATPSAPLHLRHLVGDKPASVLSAAMCPDPAVIGAVLQGADYQALVPDREASLEWVDAYLVADPPITELPQPEGVFAVIVGVPNPDAPDDLQAYLSGAGPLYGKYGAQPVAQLMVTGRPVREPQGEFISLAGFESADAVEGLFSDPDYQALDGFRDRGLSSLDVYVTV